MVAVDVHADKQVFLLKNVYTGYLGHEVHLVALSIQVLQLASQLMQVVPFEY